MNKLGTPVLVVAILLSVMNAFLFALWWSMVRVEVNMPVAERGYSLEAIAVNLTTMQMVLGLVGFVVAVLAFFGYSEVKSVAAAKAKEVAEKEARAEANKQMASFLTQMREMGITPATNSSSSAGSYGVTGPEAGQVREAGVE